MQLVCIMCDLLLPLLINNVPVSEHYQIEKATVNIDKTEHLAKFFSECHFFSNKL